MELLIGDRRTIQNPETFPQPFPPFTSAADNLALSPLPVPPDDDFNPSHGFPPQKLRPIRGNTRSPSQVRNDNQLGPLQHRHSNAMELDATFDKLGVLENGVCADAAGFFCLPPDDADCVGIGRSLGEGQCPTRDCYPRHESGSVRQKLNVEANSDGGVCQQNESSSSSTDDDDDDDSSARTKKGAGGKRKRRTREKLEQFVERLTMEVMEKQERFHAELMVMLERKEKERIMREEAWKLQEIERMEREEAARAEEMSRNRSLISFIHKAIGDNNGGEEIHQAVVDDPYNKRWPEAESKALIKLRTCFEHKFKVLGYSSSYVWHEVSAKMQNMGYRRSPKKCREKWENMNSYFRRWLANGEKRRRGKYRLPYFSELEQLYKHEVCSLTKAPAPNQMTGDETESDEN
ncbi:Trihelix transcription factor GT-2 [Linum grandiflorum]